MEKQTRVQKYKDLREEMKEEVAINRHLDEEEEVVDDDFLAFIPDEDKNDFDDTLMNPLSYETLEKDHDVAHALNEAKVNVGKEQYNTRLDILNKIKQDDAGYQHAAIEQEPTIQEEKPKPKMSLLEKLAAMSPEEDAEELKKYEKEEEIIEVKKEIKVEPIKVDKKPIKENEDISVADLVKAKKKAKKKEKIKEERYEADEDNQESSRLVTVLNYVIIAFIIIFVVLVGFIIKQSFF